MVLFKELVLATKAVLIFHMHLLVSSSIQRGHE